MQRIIKHNAVRRITSEERPAQAAEQPLEAAPEAASPGVRVHRADGRVHAIEVTCACGETTLIELAYEENEQ